MANIPIPISFTLQLDADDLTSQVNQKVQAAILNEMPAISDRVTRQLAQFDEGVIAHKVNMFIDSSIERQVENIVRSKVQQVLNGEVIERSVRSALKKATAEAVASVLGH